MLPVPTYNPSPLWTLITRLGEAQILLPAMLLALLWLARQPSGERLALAWATATALAALLTTASKVAFIGYALGSAPWDFTGISGHAMFSAAILTVLVRLLGGDRPMPALAAGQALALAVALSRVVLGAHSWSEVAAGWLLGSAAATLALRAGHAPPLRLPRSLPLLLVAWAVLSVWQAPPSRSHDLVTRLALGLSGRPAPYQRWQLHRDHRRQHPEHVAPPPRVQPPAAPASG